MDGDGGPADCQTTGRQASVLSMEVMSSLGYYVVLKFVVVIIGRSHFVDSEGM